MQVQSKSKRDRRMKPRFEIKITADITLQLIGSSTPHHFTTCNLSENGLLLSYKENERPTFNQFSILETYLQTEDTKPLRFLSKFVRYHTDNRLAVRIIEMDSDTLKKYLDFIDRSDPAMGD